MAWAKTGNIRGISWLGIWSSGTAYAVGQGVSRLGTSYAALVANTNVDPSTDLTGKWLLIAAKGDTGATPALGTATPAVLGGADHGSATAASHEDHVHSSTVPKLQRGSGPLVGTNFCYAVRNSTFAAGNSGWTTIPFASVVAEAFDDAIASLNSTGVFTAPVSGLYAFTAVTTFTSNTTGARGIRWITGSGVVLASPPIALATNQTTNPMSAGGTMYLTAGTTLAAQVYQGSGGSMTMPANATATPQQATFALVT